MKKILFDAQLGIPSEIEYSTNKIKWNEAAYPEYRGIRTFDKMKALYENPEGVPEQLEMYYTAGRVARKIDLDYFKSNGITYEYTIIPVYDVNGECNKTHGHVHGINPATGKRRMEAFEILHGYGCFELFKQVSRNEFDCLVVLLQKGDCFIVPSDFFHLSINLSLSEPFIFADLIKDDVDTIYSYVKEKNGGPYRIFHDQGGEAYYRLNSNWADCRINLKVIRCKDCNWQNPLAGKKLYEGFIENIRRVREILEG